MNNTDIRDYPLPLQSPGRWARLKQGIFQALHHPAFQGYAASCLSGCLSCPSLFSRASRAASAA